MVLLRTAFQYSRTTGLYHHDVSTFQRAMGSIDPVSAPEMDSGAPPGPRVTSIAAGGVRSRVMPAPLRPGPSGAARHLPIHGDEPPPPDWRGGGSRRPSRRNRPSAPP